jgi:hypothetical protein
MRNDRFPIDKFQKITWWFCNSKYI